MRRTTTILKHKLDASQTATPHFKVSSPGDLCTQLPPHDAVCSTEFSIVHRIPGHATCVAAAEQVIQHAQTLKDKIKFAVEPIVRMHTNPASGWCWRKKRFHERIGLSHVEEEMEIPASKCTSPADERRRNSSCSILLAPWRRTALRQSRAAAAAATSTKVPAVSAVPAVSVFFRAEKKATALFCSSVLGCSGPDG